MARPKGIPAHNRRDLTGQLFGRLAVVSQALSRQQCGTTVGYWLCRCDCGAEAEVQTSNLLSGNTQSCGCRNRDRRNGNQYRFKHGHTMRNSPTYRSWQGMRRRCCPSRSRYGARGIVMDPRWDSFQAFLADMGERPEGTTLDRIDNDGPYSPENCRWATPTIQGNNRGNTIWIAHNGRNQPLAVWAREYGLKHRVLYMRLKYGWDMEAALTTPVLRRPRRSPG
jgi:hypothetical protein